MVCTMILVFYTCCLQAVYEEIIELDQAFNVVLNHIKQKNVYTIPENIRLLIQKGEVPEKIYKAIIEYFNTKKNSLAPFIKSGYLFFVDNEERYMKGSAVTTNLLDYINAEIKKYGDKDQILSEIVQVYKIHLMPRHSDMYAVIIQLLEALLEDDELKTLINSFKVKLDFSKKTTDTMGNVFALIVIYTAPGKENSQKALDKLYLLFQGQEGLDITPRFNQKVTSLIYFAQGDADDKKSQKNDKYYELPAKIYYNPMISGSYQDYHLKIPMH